MSLIGFPERFQFYDPSFVPDPPRDDLFRMFAVVGFDDRPAAMRTVVAAPFEMVQLPGGMDFPDDCITVACLMW